MNKIMINKEALKDILEIFIRTLYNRKNIVDTSIKI